MTRFLVQAAGGYGLTPWAFLLDCSKRMTSADQGDLYLDWSGGRDHDLASSFPLSLHGVLHFYYSRQELTGLCLERTPVTVFNEMPHFDADGR